MWWECYTSQAIVDYHTAEHCSPEGWAAQFQSKVALGGADVALEHVRWRASNWRFMWNMFKVIIMLSIGIKMSGAGTHNKVRDCCASGKQKHTRSCVAHQSHLVVSFEWLVHLLIDWFFCEMKNIFFLVFNIFSLHFKCQLHYIFMVAPLVPFHLTYLYLLQHHNSDWGSDPHTWNEHNINVWPEYYLFAITDWDVIINYLVFI